MENRVCRCGQSDPSMFYKTLKNCKVCHREWTRNHRLKKLGITRELYLNTLHDQLGACAICRKQESQVVNTHRGLHVDHDHRTGKFRGILCARCNQVLGKVHDDPNVLYGMLKYLADNE